MSKERETFGLEEILIQINKDHKKTSSFDIPCSIFDIQ